MPWMGAFHSFESSIVIQFPVYITKNESAKLRISLLGTITFYMLNIREYWMLIEWLLPHHIPLSRQQVRPATQRKIEKRETTCRRKGVSGRGQIIRRRESLRSSINHSILSLSLRWIQLTNIVDSGIPYWIWTWLVITCSTHRSRHLSQLC